MSYMFYGCSSLNSLPDISKWDTKNVTDEKPKGQGQTNWKRFFANDKESA